MEKKGGATPKDGKVRQWQIFGSRLVAADLSKVAAIICYISDASCKVPRGRCMGASQGAATKLH